MKKSGLIAISVLLLLVAMGDVLTADQHAVADTSFAADPVTANPAAANPAAPDRSAAAFDPADLQLRHPIDPRTRQVVSGHNQSGIVGKAFKYPMQAQVIDETGQPVAGVLVQFDLVAPSVHHLGEATTDGVGIARLPIQAGELAREHTVVATIDQSSEDHGRIVYHLPVRKSNWAWFMLFGLAGGLGLFLYGMGMMSNALQRTAGSKMRAILGALTRNRYIGVAVGPFVTMLIQSSSATTVMLVSFVQARLMNFAQTLGVILGADIGTTVTAQLIAFKLTDYALLMVAVGFVMRVVGARRGLHNIGTVLLGFGMLFYGMHIMSQAMSPLRNYQPFLNLLSGLENPTLGILIGTIFTALIQSSSAFTGIIIVLAQQGFLTLSAGIPLIFGANIGTCITAALATLNADREAKRVALAHTLFKVIGVLIFVWWIPQLAAFVRSISPGSDVLATDPATMARLIPRQVANAHTVFNVSLTVLFLPFTALFARLIQRLLPDQPEPLIEEKFKAKHLEPELLSTPALALNLAKVEILRLGNVVRETAQRAIDPFLQRDVAICAELHESEELVDALDEQITDYLLEVGKQNLSEQQAREVYMMMHVTKQFEHMADIIDKQLCPLVRKMLDTGATFSPTGRAEVEVYHLKMIKQISRCLDVFRDGSLEKAEHLTRKMDAYIALEAEYRQAHFERVRNAVTESLTSSEIHLELMDHMRRINSYATNVGRAIMAHPDLDDSVLDARPLDGGPDGGPE